MEQNKLPDDLQMMMDASVKFCADHHSDLSPHIAVRAAVKTWAEKYAALRAKADRLQDRVQNILEYIAECKGGSISIEGRLTAIENTLSRTLEQESKEGNKCIGFLPSVNGIQPDQPSAIGILPLLSGLQPEGENKGGMSCFESPILTDKDMEDWEKLTAEEMQERKEAIDWYCNPEGEKEPVPQQGENDWISVKKQLPYRDGDSSIYCLVNDTYNGITVRPYNEAHGCWDQEDGDDYYTDAIGGNITHWKPLPEPPKKEVSNG